MSQTFKTESGRILELKEGIVVNADGSEARSSSRHWLLGVRPGSWVAGLLAAFAIPAALIFGLALLGGFFSLVALFALLQPLLRGRVPRAAPPPAR